MEFICVFSVGGSLASYQVKREEENKYKAVLRNSGGKREDVPAQVALEKNGGEWKAVPMHQEVVAGLIHCIDSEN